MRGGCSGLAWHHTDPFDRQILAQALAEDIPVVTSDEVFALDPGVRVIWWRRGSATLQAHRCPHVLSLALVSFFDPCPAAGGAVGMLDLFARARAAPEV